ncbi:hypothetical protein AK812_SmicGene1199 [Symbiodinium microadriaticum]|uniref:Uncharacterized protein n=1 Tax=Symbiodinium microadriaticum TaxID=2951 RepID=A0A1Q9F4S8_SYMMI|nr:hypothetical protein AK812_SmicGene1199 [Symbiodinium microadriaticum]
MASKRRKKTDPNIVPDLPDKVEMSHEVELTAFQRKLYKAVQEAYERAQLDRSAASYKLARSLDQKRRPSDVAAADYPAAEKEKASGKSEKLHELLEETIFPNNAVCASHIRDRLVLQGDVSQKQRDAAPALEVKPNRMRSTADGALPQIDFVSDSFEARLDDIMQHPGHADQNVSE